MTEPETNNQHPHPRQRSLRRWLRPTAVLLVFAVWAVTLHQSIWGHMLWEDEALNLTVPRNLVAGFGYASDGALSGNAISPFDVRISTGPLVLLPIALLHWLGVDLVLAGRLVVAGYAIALAIGLYRLGAMLQPNRPTANTKTESGHPAGAASGRISWAGLLCALVPLTYNTWLTVSPIQGPADVLGEYPAAAFLVWALVTLRRRPWLSGLLIGCAVQCKFIALLAVPAFTIGVLIAGRGGIWQRVRAVMAAATSAVIPTVAYELWVLATLGWTKFRAGHLRDFRSFLLDGYQAQIRPEEKLDAFLHAWFLPAPLAAAFLLVVPMAGALAWAIRWSAAQAPYDKHNNRSGKWLGSLEALVREGQRGVGPRTQMVLISAIGFATFVLWWITSSSTPLWVRHPALGVLAFAPGVVTATCVLCTESVRRKGARLSWVSTESGIWPRVCATVLVLTVCVQVTGYMRGQFAEPVAFTLEEQRTEAAQLHTSDHQLAVPWGLTVSMVVLTGAQVMDLAGPEQTVQHVRRLLPVEWRESCGVPVAQSAHFLVCEPAQSVE